MTSQTSTKQRPTAEMRWGSLPRAKSSDESRFKALESEVKMLHGRLAEAQKSIKEVEKALATVVHLSFDCHNHLFPKHYKFLSELSKILKVSERDLW